ncbi:hypothetical protein BJP34_07630 [Moorena producens PAL-8-15-08-1]|uniref:Helix-turn-helix domain-containing protein n=1 Tax=Moorena producens PAL-8-15-08-1 TaxID=1458985 RepID=A0A1D8TP13_9CYAN|nr:helix-turn-helix domain-containing protein [Moorena producens]AOW99344.1 hypothetical protein BJP34_07630 [Moorena producens PAL-8-15-08-1]
MKKPEFISKVFLFIVLVLMTSTLFVDFNEDRYKKGLNLKEEEYVADFSKHKQELLDSKKGTNFIYSLTVTFVGLLIIIGGYETLIFIISLQIKKVIHSTVSIESKSLLTIDDMEHLTGLSKSYLKHAIEKGEIKVKKIQKSDLANVKVKRSELDKFVDEQF